MTKQNVSEPDHYRVRVNRGSFPSMAILEEQFSQGCVSPLFNGEYEWTKNSSRTGANDVTAEEVVMVMKQFSDEEIREMGGLKIKNIIAWGLKNGLVPADEKEVYAFGINPETRDLYRGFCLVGLGSFVTDHDHDEVAILRNTSGRRILDGDWKVGHVWHVSNRFLFVCK